MGLFGMFGKPAKKTLEDFMRGDAVITMKDLLELEEITCRPDVVAAAYKMLQDPKHAHDGYDILGPLAADGDAEAQLIMGNFCEAVLQRNEQAVTWFQRAADQGLPQAQRNYANMLMVGKGVQRDSRKAFTYYEKAANAGIPEAQFVLGEFFRNGDIVPKDDKAAIAWYQQAIRQGYEPAKARLRAFYPNEA